MNIEPAAGAANHHQEQRSPPPGIGRWRLMSRDASLTWFPHSPQIARMNSLTTLSPKQLRRAADIQERILKLKGEFEQLLVAPIGTPTAAAAQPEKAYKFSAAARAKMRKAQKARWAKIKGAQESTNPDRKPRRKRSAAVRKRLSELAKARWARARAAGKIRL
jgi:hypothetical protein